MPCSASLRQLFAQNLCSFSQTSRFSSDKLLACKCFHTSHHDYSDGKTPVWVDFDRENDQLFGPRIDSSISQKAIPCEHRDLETNGKVTTNELPSQASQPRIESSQSQENSNQLFNFLPMVPHNHLSHKVEQFPVLNPWRTVRMKSSQHPEELELNNRRNLILKENQVTLEDFPSVTRIIGATMSIKSRTILKRWKIKMINQLGEDGFQEYQRKVFRRGKNLHKNIQLHLMKKNDSVVIDNELEPYWASLSSVLPRVTEPKLLEEMISHPFLCYKGIVDCVARLDKKLSLIDWKTSSREKPTFDHLYDEPLQVAAYVGALNYDRQTHFQVKNVAIVVVYEDGRPADVHQLTGRDLQASWLKWLTRLQEFWSQQKEENKSTKN
ncbi:mitochondrial genome maintenance exonuclease 1-like [Brevipalpus obovatus]|uniref:mitochondrial genome maintenance exonuclease 1-like n=1 Tax=Brevipalpus obovatus TaxID=246614 RepID=UPI003D9F4A69